MTPETQFLYSERMRIATSDTGQQAIFSIERGESVLCGMILFAKGIKDVTLRDIDSDKNAIRQRMIKDKARLGNKFSRSIAAADYAEEMLVEPREFEAGKSLVALNDISSFILSIDMALGARLALTALSLAQNAQGADSGIAESGALGETFDMFSQLRQNEQQYADLFKQDNKGFLLLDTLLVQAKQDPKTYFPNLEPTDVLLIGMEAAINVYKKVYPLTV